MYFPKFWAQGHWEGPGADGSRIRGSAWGWSDDSLEDAARLGEQRAQRAAFARSVKGYDAQVNRYPYASTPLREVILRKIGTSIVSRNAYGCEVLNTEDIVFVDVDLPEVKASGGGLFSALFGKKKAPDPKLEMEREKIALLENFSRAQAGLCFRVYRTAKGLRYLLTSKTLPPDNEVVQNLFAAVVCDENYRNLCNLQKSFRARLTPKPWRANCAVPPHRYPFQSQSEMGAMEQWITEYRNASSSFATCKFLQAVGGSRIDPVVEDVLREHDAMTCAMSELPLA
ncbi:MAG: hypothetical protein U0136_16155 [Bdellovibrionota bacterium]